MPKGRTRPFCCFGPTSHPFQVSEKDLANSGGSYFKGSVRREDGPTSCRPVFAGGRVAWLVALALSALSLSVASCKRAAVQPEPAQAATAAPSASAHSSLDTVRTSLKWGQTLDDLLARAGLNPRERLHVAQALQRVCSLRSLKAGARFELLYDSTHALQQLNYFPTSWQSFSVRREGRTWRAFEESRPVRTEVRTLAATVRTTIYDAFLEAGEDPELVALFSDIFQWDIDFFIDPKPGDQFKLIYQVKLVDGPEGPVKIGYGRILAAQYVLQGKPITAVYFDNPKGKSGYYDANGKSFQKTFLRSPLNYRKITSYFTGARYHPILKKVRPHYAVDFAAPAGTPVVAAGDGTVIEKGYNRGLGNYLKIRHTNPHYVTLYGHLRGFAKGIRKGVHVRQNQVIGYVGQTGLATGPHLHYAFYENGRPINPLRIRNVTADPVPREAWPEFVKVRDEMLARLRAIRPLPHSISLTGGWPFLPRANVIGLPAP